MAQTEDYSEYGAEAFLAIPALRSPQLSPDETRVAWRSTIPGRPEIWAADLTEQAAWQVTDQSDAAYVRQHSFAWLDNEHLITRKSHNPGEQRLRILNVTDGEVTRTLPVVRERGSLEVAAEGRFLYTGWNDGLHRLDLRSGALERLNELVQPFPLRVDPRDEWLAFDASEGLGTPSGPSYCRLDGSDLTRVPNENADARSKLVDWHPDGGQLLLHEVPTDRLGLYTLDSERIEWVAEIPEATDVFGFIDPDRIVLKKPPGHLYTHPLGTDGQSELLTPDVRVKDAVATGTGMVVAATQALPTKSPRIARISDETDQTAYATSYGPVRPQEWDPSEMEYPATEGRTASVQVHAVANEPAPVLAVVYSPWPSPHGFPIGHAGRGIEYFVSQGYSVVRAATPSPPLSMDGIEDQQLLGEWLIGQEWVEEDRIAVLGHSAGGRDVAQLLSIPEQTPWKAGVMYNGSPDLIADYEYEARPVHDPLGDPAENQDKWHAVSPIENLDSGLNAPLRIHHATEDGTVPIQQARDFRDRLLETGHVEGADFEYHELPREGHGSSVRAENGRNLTMIADFLDRRV